ncbi:MAG TPA: Uma2 family endonuclease [Terriglobia bacterium]|jgi:Uma2 family endonuclease
MPTEVTRKLFTVDDFYRMDEAGIFVPEERVELIGGEILEMSPVNQPHFSCVNRTAERFFGAFHGRAMISVQNALPLNRFNVPQPDIAVLKPRSDFYASLRQGPLDAFFVVEVSDTTFRFDRNIKLPLYAEAGIPEVWIENLKEGVLLVFRGPVGNDYKTKLILRRAQSVSPLAFPDVLFKIEDLLG